MSMKRSKFLFIGRKKRSAVSQFLINDFKVKLLLL
jgi:hypothetical protein